VNGRMTYFCPLIVVAVLLAQNGSQATAPLDPLTPAEKSRLEAEPKVDDRIKIYQTASERFRSTLQTQIKEHEFETLQGLLDSWLQLLETSAKDIDTSITNRKKKSKALIRYEIQLRRSISDVQGYKTTVPVDVFDAFEAWAKQAENIHQTFVDILFPK
jgi:hypothetical protein